MRWALIGFAGIRNMALSLVLLEHMHDKAHANQLKEEFLRSLMAGSLASELCGVQRDGEEAFIGATFQNLGRLLTEFYFPEEARQVRSLVNAANAKNPSAARNPNAEHAASITVLGLSFEDLGLGVAKSWGLPEGLQRCMRRPAGEPPNRACDKAERVQWVALAANDITDALMKAEPGRASAAIAGSAERYSKGLGPERARHAGRGRARAATPDRARQRDEPAGATRLADAPPAGAAWQWHGRPHRTRQPDRARLAGDHAGDARARAAQCAAGL